MNEKVEVRELSLCKALIPTLAQWFENEWGYQGDSFDYGVKWLTDSLGSSNILPITFVAFLENTPVGTGRIMSDQLEHYPQYNPWFAYWYVLPEYRGRGVGTAVDQARIAFARENGWEKVFLGTTTQEEYRKKRGWRIVERGEMFGEHGTVMSFDLREELVP